MMQNQPNPGAREAVDGTRLQEQTGEGMPEAGADFAPDSEGIRKTEQRMSSSLGAAPGGEISTQPRPGVYHYTPAQTRDKGARLVQALGWFSIGLGLAQLLAPRRMTQAVGADGRARGTHLMRALGAREVASGVGILTQRKPTGWLWSRVAGDAMDLALLGAAARSPDARRNRIGIATAAVAGIAALDLLTSMKAPEHRALGDAIEFEKTIIVNRSREACYRFWRDLEGLPRFMRHLESVTVLDEHRSYWKAKGPLGFTVEWESELSADEPEEFMAWRSISGSEVDNEGTVRFERAPGGRGTLIYVWMRYMPPGGVGGALLAKLFGESPEQQLDEDLRRFKWLIETGEIPTTVGQPSGVRGMWNRLALRKGAPG
ncbi:MAG TPA: SRPBCC family protein [Noviherbaspirillum sp.]